jgi:tRNA threonylcarbamoyl adenosine modification protein (Sua5/YciO/YrdC/YwlC family)
MTQYFRIHPGNPQKRLIRQAADILREGGVVVYPTDSCYAIGCRIGDKDALERIRRIRQLDDKHNLTLMCEDLSGIATYAKVSNPVFRLMKAYMPGPYTFLLLATRDVPKRLQHPKRKTIGVRVPDHPVTRAMLMEIHEPILSTSLILPGEDMPLTSPEEINNKLGKQVDLILDGGICGIESTTVIDLAGEQPVIVRQGKGNIHAL